MEYLMENKYKMTFSFSGENATKPPNMWLPHKTKKGVSNMTHSKPHMDALTREREREREQWKSEGMTGLLIDTERPGNKIEINPLGLTIPGRHRVSARGL